MLSQAKQIDSLIGTAEDIFGVPKGIYQLSGLTPSTTSWSPPQKDQDRDGSTNKAIALAVEMFDVPTVLYKKGTETSGTNQLSSRDKLAALVRPPPSLRGLVT